jgi:hypothetical protein
MTTKTFFDNINNSPSWVCGQANSRNALTLLTGSGAGHHGNVHLAIGGCLGGSFHQAPASCLFSLWHADLDKVWHDWEVNCGNSDKQQSRLNKPDLYIADRENDDDLTTTSHNGIDMGYEPNEAPNSYPMWVSDDIWIRNQPDGIEIQEHENPIYQTGAVVYVYVRVRNRGGQTSTGNEVLKLYWAKANTSLDYPNAWVGNNVVCSKPSGSQISLGQAVTPLQPEGYKIYVFPFQLPNPADYSCVGQVDHFCLLARITDPTLPNEGMTFAETTDLYANVRNNNNIAWKNISIIDPEMDEKRMTATVLVGADKCKDGNCLTKLVFKVPFVVPKHSKENTDILNYAQIDLKLNPVLYEAFKQSNMKMSGGEWMEGGTLRILPQAQTIEIPLLLKKNTTNGTIQVNIVRTKPFPKYLPELKFDIIHTDINGKRTIGGQRFILPITKYKPVRKKK